MARKFLYIVAFLIVLAILGLIALRVWSRELTEIALVPTTEFVEQSPLEANAYQDPELWFSRPGIGLDDPARWQPAYRGESREVTRQSEPTNADGTESEDSEAPSDYAVFFVHPTSYYGLSNWNAPRDDAEANRVAKLYIRGMASPFNGANEIWAPRYRQATVGAFLTEKREAQQALDAAYNDVEQAFDYFLQSVGEGTPVILVGHSQGSLHLLRLLKERSGDTALKNRLIAAYIIGWPISVERDLPALGLAACATRDQSGCIVSWSTFAEPADPSDLLETYSRSVGFDGQPRGQSTILCTNPLTGQFGGDAGADQNLGTLVPDGDLSNGELVRGSVPARCDERGLLLIGNPPEMGSYVLPGNNYHVYDIPLFWANTKADSAARVEAWLKAR